MRAVAALAGLSLASAAPSLSQRASSSSLIVDEAPQTLQAYVLRKGDGRAESVGSQVYRFSVTGNSSAGAFTLMQTNAPSSGSLGVLPHIHKVHYENFYCTKGRVELWAEPSDNSTGQAGRVLTAGDYGAVPHNTIHTFQITDPDTQLTGVIQPGGFEALFLAIGDGPFTSSTGSVYVPGANDSSSSGSSTEVISALEAFDVYGQLDFVPRRDLVNGTTGAVSAATTNWHNGSNSLAIDAYTPNFIAKNYGPKYLNTDGGVYRLVAPLATGEQTAGNFSMGTITMSPPLANQTATTTTPKQPLALQLEEGALVVSVEGYDDEATLIQGDVVFVPANTTLTYHAAAGFTRFLYVSGGGGGFDHDLLSRSVAWEYATYPVDAGFVVQ